MPLNIGSRLGHYDVTALIGEGGMRAPGRVPRLWTSLFGSGRESGEIEVYLDL